MAEDFLLESVDFSSDESDDSSSSMLVSSSLWIVQRSITDEATFLPLLELLDEVRPISTGSSSELVLLDESDSFGSGWEGLAMSNFAFLAELEAFDSYK